GVDESIKTEVLFPEFRSATPLETEAVLVMVPSALGRSVTITVAIAPALRVPKVQLTLLGARVQEPCEDWTAMIAVPELTRSFSTTFVAADGPELVMVMVAVVLLPAATGFGEAVWLMAKSASGFTVTNAEAESL